MSEQVDNLKNFVKSYQKNYKKDFNKDISSKEGYNSLFNIVGYVKALEKIQRRLDVEKKLQKKYNGNKKDDTIKMDTANTS